MREPGETWETSAGYAGGRSALRPIPHLPFRGGWQGLIQDGAGWVISVNGVVHIRERNGWAWVISVNADIFRSLL